MEPEVAAAMDTGKEEKTVEGKEGKNLLGSPSYTKLDNGRLKCVETGHEVLAKDKDSYSQSKRCRVGLIDFAVSHNKPPLNMFKQDPVNRAKLICKLTGNIVNKSEEHIWKHINGKRFLNKLEQMEMEKLEPDEAEEDAVNEKKKKKEKKRKKKKEKEVEQIVLEMRDSSEKESDAEEVDFWMPPVGERWDFDDGGDQWGTDSESGEENGEEDGIVEDGGKESEELWTRTKRMSIEIGPSSYASRKKKSKQNDS